ncbi:protein-methionine sulfoxide oxidase mical2b isoform X2 [Gasterosteus aculeatus]
MSAVKALQQWCRVRCDGYRDVSITNMTTSFRDGLAFCALLHHHRPDLIDFDSLKKDDVYENNKLAFRVAEDLGIPALLDAEDMVALKVPDRLSILTYVSQYYNYFHGRSPIGGMGGIKRPAGDPAGGPSGKKNQPVAAKVFPSSKPARENSPPPSSNITRAPPSPTPRGHATKVNGEADAAADRPLQTGTLSNKCASCDKHVHLVQRHLVEGKLYHRSCAKTLAATSPTAAAPRSSPSNVPVSTSAPLADSGKTTAPTPAHTPSRLGPSWLTVKAGTSSPPSQPPSGVSPKGTRAHAASKPAVTTSINAGPVAAPRTSAAASKNLQSKLKFFQSERDEEKKPPPAFGAVLVSKRPDATAKVQEAAVGQPLTVVVNVGGLGRKEAGVGPSPGGDGAKAAGGGGLQKSKSSAAAFISKKLSEENNNNNAAKPPWATVALKKPDAPPQAETPRREPPGARGRKVLRADRSILDDVTAARTPSPVRPDRGGPRPNAAASENQAAPEDWRSKLKPIAKPAGPSQSSPKPWARGGGTPQTSEVSVRPSRSPKLHHPTVSVTPPAAKGFLNAANGTKSELKKMKPDYISKEDIIRELQEIEDNLNEWEKRGVELEVKLRGSEEEGEEDSLMDEVMVEWFNLIRNKQVAMRRESELVYIGKNQDLEEEQPTVEQELRRLMDKPDHLKTPQDRKRENQLMDKLVEIVNDRNAIVEGLDEDRLREDEEDQELNKMMMSFNIKKDKPKKKSPMSKLFNWGSKKEG